MSYEKAKSLIRNSISRPTLYKVIMPSKFMGGNTNDYLEYYCLSTAIPEVRVESVVARGHENMGIARSQPSLMIWGSPMTISVIENQEFSVHRDFKRWFDRLGTNANQEGGRNMRMQYYKQIVGDIQLVKLENPPNSGGGVGEQLQEVLRVKFINAFPKAIGAVNLSSENRNNFTTFNVEFNYESYSTEYS